MRMADTSAGAASAANHSIGAHSACSSAAAQAASAAAAASPESCGSAAKRGTASDAALPALIKEVFADNWNCTCANSVIGIALVQTALCQNACIVLLVRCVAPSKTQHSFATSTERLSGRKMQTAHPAWRTIGLGSRLRLARQVCGPAGLAPPPVNVRRRSTATLPTLRIRGRCCVAALNASLCSLASWRRAVARPQRKVSWAAVAAGADPGGLRSPGVPSTAPVVRARTGQVRAAGCRGAAVPRACPRRV